MEIRLENRIQELEQVRQEIFEKDKLNRFAEQTFVQEYGLGYVIKDSEGSSDSRKNCKKVIKELRQYDNEQKTREDYVSRLLETYNNNQQFLLEYNISLQYLFEEGQTQYDNLEIRRLAENRRRLDLSARLEGREAGFYTLTEYIDQSIDQNEKLLREEDRHLFEDILINTVGKKIRARIYHSERWVEKSMR